MKFQDGEEILHDLKPEQNILIVWFFTKAIPFAAVIVLLCVFFTIFYTGLHIAANPDESESFPGNPILIIITAFVAGLVLGLIYSFCLRATYRYYITSHRCIFCGGIIRRVQRSVPYHKITDVEISQEITERILGISTLNIFTPGTGSIGRSGKQKAELTFVGLKDSETPAETINKMLEELSTTKH